MVELKVHGARLWEREQLADIMDASVILHMLVEDERGIHDIPDDNTYEQGHAPHLAELDQGPIHGFAEVLEKDMEIRDGETHDCLKEDLIEHIRQKFGGQQQQANNHIKDSLSLLFC